MRWMRIQYFIKFVIKSSKMKELSPSFYIIILFRSFNYKMYAMFTPIYNVHYITQYLHLDLRRDLVHTFNGTVIYISHYEYVLSLKMTFIAETCCWSLLIKSCLDLIYIYFIYLYIWTQPECLAVQKMLLLLGFWSEHSQNNYLVFLFLSSCPECHNMFDLWSLKGEKYESWRFFVCQVLSSLFRHFP